MRLPLDHVFIASKKPSRRLMVVLHGRGDSATGFAFLPQALRLEEMNYVLLNAPDFYYTGYSWYDLPPGQLPGILRSRRVLEELFDALFEEGYAPEETFLFGFSQGCLLTVEFGARYRHALAGYIGISGYVYDPALVLKQLNPHANAGNWLITHGHHDDVLDIRETRRHVLTLQEGGLDIDYREYPKGHTVSPKELEEIREWILRRV